MRQRAVAAIMSSVLSAFLSVGLPYAISAAEGCCTPEATARLAVAAAKYDIAGMKLGTPLKEVMQTLKAHNPKLQMKKETI